LGPSQEAKEANEQKRKKSAAIASKIKEIKAGAFDGKAYLRVGICRDALQIPGKGGAKHLKSFKDPSQPHAVDAF
jgi:hypothetical protein